MLNIKGLSIANDGDHKRMAITYDEIDETGKVIGSNIKINRIIVDDSILTAVSTIENFAKTIIKG